MAAPYMITIPAPILSTSKTLAKLPYHMHTLYLFTAADFSTFAIPTTLFATFASLSGAPLTTHTTPSLLPTLSRIPHALLLTWTNLLLFNISNQRTPTSIAEDLINKPHRPLPSKRLTSEHARLLLLCVAPLVMLLSWALGAWEECLLLVVFTWMYNDLGGSDTHFVVRNALIAIGYGLYSSAALRVMIAPGHDLAPLGLHWIFVVTAVMFVTQHICDIKDAEGDRLRGRKSAPIVLGDMGVRWSVAVPVLVSSVVCPAFFALPLEAYVLACGMGGVVAFRTLFYRDLASDKTTWKLWALWTCLLFALPLIGSPAVLVRAWADSNTFMSEIILDVKCALCGQETCAGVLDLAAVSGIAMVIEGRRIYAQAVSSHANMSVPEIVVEGIVG